MKRKLNEFKDRLVALSVHKQIPPDRNGHFLMMLKHLLRTRSSFLMAFDHDGVKEVWEASNFYHMPLVAVLTNLAKIQTDVMNAKNNVVTALSCWYQFRC
ncbi:MAG: hypothetical protein R2809_13335 [Flavobacteriales bacterium]